MSGEKKKITLEYPVNSTMSALFQKLSTAAGLETWFAEKVEKNGSELIFYWQKMPHEAELIAVRENRHVRFRWKDDPPDSYVEFLLDKYELTGDLFLYITDFGEENEHEEIREMWDHSVRNLKRQLGAG